MASSVAEGKSMPWQPAFAGSALFAVAGIHFITALTFIADLSDWQGIKATLPDWQAISERLAAATAEEIYEWLMLSAYVFGTLAVVFLVLGLLTWRGVARQGVRVTSTIFVVISWLGALRLVASADGGGTGTGAGPNAFFLLVLTVALVAMITLWISAGARWVRGD